MDLDTKDDLWLIDQLIKCRCCFKKFKHSENQVQITKSIQKQFLELTQIELKISPSYSNNVCMKCTNELSSISNFRLNLISKQKQLYHNITSQYLTQDVIKFESVDVKHETQSGDEFDNIFNVEAQYEEDESPKSLVIFETKDRQSPTKDLSLRYQKIHKLKMQTNMPKTQVERQQKCSECEKIFHNSSNLKKHIRSVHLKLKKVFCDLCGYGKMNKKVLETHMKSHIRKKIQSQLVSNKIPEKAICPHCGIILKRFTFLRRHIERVHLKLKNYFCDTCNFGARDKSYMKNHVKTHIPTEFREKFFCDQCNHVSFSLSLLKTHKKCEHSIEATKYECHCGKVYAQLGQLNHHKKYSHGDYKATKNHVCFICKKGFHIPYKLKIHMECHSEKREIPCDFCGKMFVTLRQLKMHSVFHKDRRFVCSFEGCTKKFFGRNSFEAHKKTHIEQRDYACHLCDKKYFASNHLHRHVLNFHKQLKVSCELPGCSSKFARKETYRNHVLSHHKDLSEVKIELLLKKIREMKQE